MPPIQVAPNNLRFFFKSKGRIVHIEKLGFKSVADLKTLSPCGPYPNDRTGNPNVVVNARQ